MDNYIENLESNVISRRTSREKIKSSIMLGLVFAITSGFVLLFLSSLSILVSLGVLLIAFVAAFSFALGVLIANTTLKKLIAENSINAALQFVEKKKDITKYATRKEKEEIRNFKEEIKFLENDKILIANDKSVEIKKPVSSNTNTPPFVRASRSINAVNDSILPRNKETKDTQE